MSRIPFQVVLDTQVWLDWLVFEDPGIAPLREAQATGRVRIVIDDACESELVRVLAYDLGRFTLQPDAQRRCAFKIREVAHRVPVASLPALPTCRDPDDQKFLVLAANAKADLLVTKDRALLALARWPLAFRIVTPAKLEAVLGAK